MRRVVSANKDEMNCEVGPGYPTISMKLILFTFEPKSGTCSTCPRNAVASVHNYGHLPYIL
jgi:hypothetical protein